MGVVRHFLLSCGWGRVNRSAPPFPSFSLRPVLWRVPWLDVRVEIHRCDWSV